MNIWRYADPEMAHYSQEVVDRLMHAGYEAYWVGGCVRDELLGRALHDMDITTSAEPEQVMNLFEHTIPTGMQHGTVTVMIRGCPFEVTTFRTEGGYEDHRRPTEVTFVKNIREDLMRRDFTMNAIAMQTDGKRVDPFDGETDLSSRIVRCVGRADERFEEDGLRMLRCIRFASVFRFHIAYNTWKGLIRKKELLRYIAMERVRTEMEKMIAGPDPLRGLELLRRSGLLSYTKARTPWEMCDAAWLTGLDQLSPDLRVGLILLSCGLDSVSADECLRQWTFSNAVRVRYIRLLDWEAAIVELAGTTIQLEQLRRVWIGLLVKLGSNTATDWLQIQRVLPSGLREQSALTEKHFSLKSIVALLFEHGPGWTAESAVLDMKGLDITGNDLLLSLNRPAGPWLGQIMNELLLAAACHDIPNQKERLIEEAKRVISVEKS